MISGYYCNKCSSRLGHLDFLKTGSFLNTPDQSGYHRTHTQTRPTKPTNGVFFDSGTGFYQRGGNQIGESGFIEIEVSGGINAYCQFLAPIAVIEISGIRSGVSEIGKAVLISNPNYCHWHPVTGYGSVSGWCSECGRKLF